MSIVKNDYVITDGLHRASILKNRSIKSIIVKEKFINEKNYIRYLFLSSKREI